jgi:predicted esterase
VSKGGRGRLVLARVAAGQGNVDLAIHWLQLGEREEGIDPEAVLDDARFAGLRRDSRWPALFDFLKRSSAYWGSQPRTAEFIVRSGDPQKRRSVALVLVLPENGGDPADFVDQDRYRREASHLGVTFAAITAPIPLGPMAYRWSTDAGENERRVDEGLAAVRRRISARVDRVLILGFAEGAEVALDVAAHEPSVFSGAIALSPGGLPWHLDVHVDVTAVQSQRYVIAVGTFEAFDTVGTSYADASRLRDMGAGVVVHSAWLYAHHTLPPDFDVKLPHWITFVLTGVEG